MTVPTIISTNALSYFEINQRVSALLPTPQKKFLAEGDSWFSLFLNRRDPLKGTNLLWHIDTPWEAVIIDSSLSGDTLANMTGPTESRFFNDIPETRFGYKFDAILLSGGGNDVIDRLNDVLVRPTSKNYAVEDCLNPQSCANLFAALEKSLLELIAIRDRSKTNRTTPIISHSYDYITPRDLPWEFAIIRRGPWAWPTLRLYGIDDSAVQKGITDFLLSSWAERLKAIAQKADLFFVADTLGTLKSASPDDLTPKGDWHDEIHPSPGDFKKLANATDGVNAVLKRVLTT